MSGEQHHYENGRGLGEVPRTRSYDDLHDEELKTAGTHGVEMRNYRKNVKFKELRHQRSRSDDFTMRATKDYLSPSRLVWLHSGNQWYEQKTGHPADTPNGGRNQMNKADIDYSKPGASVVLMDNRDKTNQVKRNSSVLYSNRNIRSRMPQRHDHILTSSDTDECPPPLPTIPELHRSRTSADSNLDLPVTTGNEGLYSYHIPAPYATVITPSTQVEQHTEGIYHDPDNLIVRRTPRSGDVSHSKSPKPPRNRRRKHGGSASLSPPPLPPPRPASQNYSGNMST